MAPKILVCLLLICLPRCLAYSAPPLAAKIGLVASFGSSKKVLKVYCSSNAVNYKHTDTRKIWFYRREVYRGNIPGLVYPHLERLLTLMMIRTTQHLFSIMIPRES